MCAVFAVCAAMQCNVSQRARSMRFRDVPQTAGFGSTAALAAQNTLHCSLTAAAAALNAPTLIQIVFHTIHIMRSADTHLHANLQDCGFPAARFVCLHTDGSTGARASTTRNWESTRAL